MEGNPNRLPTDNRGFHIAHLNLQSFNNKLDLVKTEISILDFDVFTFSESWLHNQVDNSLLQIAGYDLLRQDRNWNDIPNAPPKRGGGIGAFIKSKHKFSTQHLNRYNKNTKHIECLWFEILLEKCKNVIIGVVYRPPSGCSVQFCDDLTEMAQDITALSRSELFIIGDFNIQYNNKTHSQFKDLMQFEQLTNLSQIITEPTRSDNTIDLIYTNSDNIRDCGVMNVLISDHELIFCTRKKKKAEIFKSEFTGRSYKHYDKEAFQTILTDHDWDFFMALNDADMCWDYLLHQVTSILDHTCPIKKRKMRCKNEPWVNNEILDLIFEKNSMETCKENQKPYRYNPC